MGKTNQNKTQLIYILSNGRSGSTLLDMLLGMNPEIWTLGEAQLLPWEVRENRLPCGCAAPIGECVFWEPILDQIPLHTGRYPIEFFRERHTGGKTVRITHLMDILLREPSHKWEVAIPEYGQLNAQYFKVVKDAAENYLDHPIKWLVDASKNIYRLFWLYHSNLFNLRIIHLIKDPRAFVYSMTKDQSYVPLSKTLRISMRWLVENCFFSFFISDKSLVEKSFFVRYEDLASKPDRAMKAIMEWLQVPHNEIDYSQFRKYENHAIAGNPMRWKDSNIRLDEKWRDNLSLNKARFIWLITGFLARGYGYKWKRLN